MSKISKADLNTIKEAVKHIAEIEQKGLGGIPCYDCPVSRAHNRLGIGCGDFINDIGKDLVTKTTCYMKLGCVFRLETMKYILKNYNKGCKI